MCLRPLYFCFICMITSWVDDSGPDRRLATTTMFGKVDIKARPLRFAYLVDPRSSEQVREAMRLSSTLWGGAFFPIIPLHKRMPASWKDPVRAPLAKPVILGYLEAFDPDILVQLSPEVPSFVVETGREIIKPDEIWKTLDEEVSLSPRFGIGIFELLDDVFQKYFKYKAKYPVKVVIPRIPDPLSLFWTSVFGEIPRPILNALEREFAEPLEIETVDFQLDELAEVWGHRVIFPRRLSQRSLRPSGRSRIRGDARVYFMDATKLEDVVDFWNLRALGRDVMPLPKQLKDDAQLREILIEFLKIHRRHWRHDPKVCDHASIIRSRNSTMEEIQAYAKTLNIDRPADDPSNDGFFSIQHWYPRIWDEWGRDKDGAVPYDMYAEAEDSVEIADAKDLRVRFKPLLPEFAETNGIHSEARCANDVSFSFYGSPEYLAEVFPASNGPHFTRAISGLTSFRGDWRVGRHGLVKIVKHDFGESREVPSAESVVFAWLTDLGWKPKLSTAGLLAKQMYRRLEGHASVLTNPKLLGFLEHMNGGLVQRDGSPVDEEDNKIAQERDLPVGEVKNRVKELSGTGNLYDYLLSKEILRLGLRLQCPHCMRNSWFALDSVRGTFTCPRCLNDFAALGNLENATWSYKTTGPFSVPNYADGAYAVLLTIDCFDDRKMTTMRISPALSFTAEKPQEKELEADFALFWQDSIFGERKEGIAFGECKTYGEFKETDFERMRRLAKAFPGAVLVFSTLRTALNASEIAKISRIAKAGRKYWKAERPINPVLVLTGTELLSFHGPPYCWDDAVKERFRNVHGLLSLCDATQQIYLRLPSWQTEWHEKWEKRRKRGEAAAGQKMK